MVSDLKSHKYKKGLIQTPMNTIPNTQSVSWTNDRLPEYLWLGLILMNYPRTQGIEKVGTILREISQKNEFILKPKLSEILALSNIEQENIYQIISKNINPKVLEPLTVIFTNSKFPILNKYFNSFTISVNEKIDILSNAVKLYYEHQSHEATDLRFIVTSMMIFQGKLKLPRGSDLEDALKNYPYTHHEDEKMKKYRPFIRTLEMMDIQVSPNKNFIDLFWKELGLKTKCNPLIIGFKQEENQVNYKLYISKYQEKISHLINSKKELSIMDDKFDVIVGTATFTLKIFNDVIEKGLDDSILGRHAYRTILESYINIKYLQKIEAEHENIWQEYKIYGIGKYKLPLLKNREITETKDETHFIEPIVEILINEIVWEEFLDIDLRYFDNKKIKEKFEEVGEKYLYEVLYEYDNNFIHGFWGAVRESAMLHCNNSTHKYHSIPDINFEQKMPSINDDIYRIIDKFSKLIDESF
jgi:hypothetical protein